MLINSCECCGIPADFERYLVQDYRNGSRKIVCADCQHLDNWAYRGVLDRRLRLLEDINKETLEVPEDIVAIAREMTRAVWDMATDSPDIYNSWPETRWYAIGSYDLTLWKDADIIKSTLCHSSDHNTRKTVFYQVFPQEEAV